MAVVGLIDLKRRIKTVTSIQKITKAMGLVATVKFKSAKANLERYRQYFENYNSLAGSLLLSAKSLSLPYCADNGGDKDLYIVETSDTGLCGSYNTGIINTVLNRTKDCKQDVLILAIGQKGNSFFSSSGYTLAGSFTGIGVNPSFKEVSHIMNQAVEMFLAGKVRNVYVVYTKFQSAVKQTIEVDKILPLEAKDSEDNNNILYEPSYKTACECLIPQYLNAVMYNIVVSSSASEFAMRMNSMDSATKNASEVLDDLKMLYNRARQGSITSEITEIVSGAEALKE